MTSKKVNIFPIGELYNYSSSESDSDNDKSKKGFFKYEYNHIYLFFIFLIKWFSRIFNLENKKNRPKVITTDMIIKEYEEKEYKRFLDIFEKEDANKNMNEEFYNLELYKETVMDTNNKLENEWKSRILFENTPRGNIVMYYDAFKKGFAYYADQASISYKILNTVAMKYVRVFSCRDLFIDDKYTPEGSPSPLIKIEKDEEKKDKERMKTEKGEPVIDKEILKNGPFLKLKKTKEKDITEKVKEEKEKRVNMNLIYNVNKFLYMGKLFNFSFIQKVPLKKKPLKMESSYFKNLFDQEHELQKEVLNYKDFKKVLKKE
jgi:hypothetical protein